MMRATPSMLPCPFCGGEGEAVSLRAGEDSVLSWARCLSCHARTAEIEDAYSDLPTARSNWNARHTSSAGEAIRGQRMLLLKSQCEVRDRRWRVTIDAGEYPCSIRVIHRQHGDYYDWPEAVLGNCVAADRAYVMQEEARLPARSSALKAAHDFLRRFGAGEVEYLEFDVDSQEMVVVGHAERRSMSGWHRHVEDTVDPLASFYPEPPAS